MEGSGAEHRPFPPPALSTLAKDTGVLCGPSSSGSQGPEEGGGGRWVWGIKWKTPDTHYLNECPFSCLFPQMSAPVNCASDTAPLSSRFYLSSKIRMGFSFFLNMLFLHQCRRSSCCGLGTVWALGMQLPKHMGCACLGLCPGLGRAHDELPSDRKEETAVGREETAETRADEQHRSA